MREHRIIDLHMHSNASDGSNSPHEVLRYAKEKRLGTISLTDHDTLLGDKSLTEEDRRGIEFITGIELSAKTKVGRMHILGYDLDLDSNTLNSRMKELHDNSIYAVIAYLNQLKLDYEIEFSEKDIIALLTAERNIGRPDLAQLCIEYGYAETVEEAFNVWVL